MTRLITDEAVILEYPTSVRQAFAWADILIPAKPKAIKPNIMRYKEEVLTACALMSPTALGGGPSESAAFLEPKAV